MAKKENKLSDLLTGGAAAILTLALMMPLALALLLSGCGLTGDGYNSKGHINSALKAMKKKYGYDFEYAGDNTALGSGDVFGRHSEYVNILVSCDELPDKKIQVFSGDGKDFADDLICVKYEDRAAEEIRELLKSIYGGDEPVIVLFGRGSTTIGAMDLPADSDYSDMLRSGGIGWVEICVDDRVDPIGKYRRLCNTLIEKGISCQPSVHHFLDTTYFAVDKNNSALGMDYMKKCGQLRVYKGNLLDDDFDGTLMLFGDKTMTVKLPLVPPADEDISIYDDYFLSRGEWEAREGSSGGTTENVTASEQPEISIPETEKPEIPEIPDITAFNG